MLYSLRETDAALTPESNNKDLYSVKTGACSLYNFETNSGLRFALYVAEDATETSHASNIRQALSHVYNDIWINYVTRSPLFRPKEPNVQDTNFEAKLEAYFSQQTWYR